VASFLQLVLILKFLTRVSKFSSLSESGFIPTWEDWGCFSQRTAKSSHLFQRVASFLQEMDIMDHKDLLDQFSSLSESGFIPTLLILKKEHGDCHHVLISFREWLHSYNQIEAQLSRLGLYVLISFREWLHSYCFTVSG